MSCYRLTNDFHVNKRIIDNIAVIQTKRLRNKIAGFTTHLMKRIQKGPAKQKRTANQRGKQRKAPITKGQKPGGGVKRAS